MSTHITYNIAGDRWEFYVRPSGWRWRHKARNGRIVGASSEAFTRLAACKRNAKKNGFVELG